MKERIYMDNAATTKVDPLVLKKMLPFFSEEYGNASSMHELGKQARQAMEESRKVIAKSINADSKEIYFTSGGTEANNWALKGLFFNEENIKKGKKHIITTKIEHDSVLKVTKWLEQQGAKVTYLEVDKEGFVNPKDIEKAITKETLVVSVIHGNNEIGTIQNIEEIGAICKKKNVYFHIDACQSYTKVEIDVKKQNLDLVTLNAHKIYGPKGIGALYIKEGTNIAPIMQGGGHERKQRSGTENIPAIIGFAEAVKISDRKDIKKISVLRDRIIKEALKIPNTKLNGPVEEKRLCNNINLSFSNIEGEALAGYLEAHDIYLSTGSACSSHSLEPSHVLKSIGLSNMQANSTIRISLSKYNTIKEVEHLIKILPKVVSQLRSISPFK